MRQRTTQLHVVSPDPIDAQTVVLALSGFGLLFAVAISIVQWARRKKAPEKPAEVVPDEPRCPCGAVATRPIPRHKVVEVPLVGRLVLRQRDAFGAPVVCDSHADVAATVIDERIAEARLADARAERDRITALANGTDPLAAIVGTLPEAQRKAWERRPKALPRKVDEGEG